MCKKHETTFNEHQLCNAETESKDKTVMENIHVFI